MSAQREETHHGASQQTQQPDPIAQALLYVKRGLLLVVLVAAVGLWQALSWPVAALITASCALLWLLWYYRGGLRKLLDAAQGIEAAAPQAPARTVAHRSEPLGQLAITLTPEQVTRMATEATIALPSVPPVSHVDVPESGTPLMLDQVLAYINKQPNIVPHLAIIGASGTGKTTFGTATLHDRDGKIVVITAKEGDTWGGLPYIGIDDDATYTTANETFRALAADMRRRLVAVKKQQSPGAVLNVVLDDYSTLRKLCASADDFFLLAARLGRSLCVRLIVLSDSALVKAWGIEGEGETRANFAFVRLARGRKGTLETEDGERPFMTTFILEIARLARLSPRAWQRPRPAVETLAEYLGIPPEQLSNVSPGGVPVQPPMGVLPTEIDTSTVQYGTGGISPDATLNTGGTALPMDDESVMIRNLLQSYSKNKVAQLLGGSKTTAYDRIDRALGEK